MIKTNEMSESEPSIGILSGHEKSLESQRTWSETVPALMSLSSLISTIAPAGANQSQLNLLDFNNEPVSYSSMIPQSVSLLVGAFVRPTLRWC